jgi:cell division protein FtsB
MMPNVYQELDELAKRTKEAKLIAIRGMSHNAPQQVMRERQNLKHAAFWGSPVYSVEGEEFSIGNKVYRGVGFLGYWMYAEEMVDAWCCYFTTPKGIKLDIDKTPLKERDYILHPLCLDGGFFVPKDGGLQFLDDGHIIMLSQSGLFSGGGGNAAARKAWDSYREALIMAQRHAQKASELSNQLVRYQQQLGMTRADNQALTKEMHEYQDKCRQARVAYDKFLVEKEALIDMVDALHEENGSLRSNLGVKLANVDKHINEILRFVHVNVLDDSARANLSDHPRVSQQRKKETLEGLYKEKIISDGEITEENKAIRKENEELSKEVATLKEKMVQAENTFEIQRKKLAEAEAMARAKKTPLGEWVQMKTKGQTPQQETPPAPEQEEPEPEEPEESEGEEEGEDEEDAER